MRNAVLNAHVLDGLAGMTDAEEQAVAARVADNAPLLAGMEE